MVCINIALLSKALDNGLMPSFTHSYTHQQCMASMQDTTQLDHSACWDGLGDRCQAQETRRPLPPELITLSYCLFPRCGDAGIHSHPEACLTQIWAAWSMLFSSEVPMYFKCRHVGNLRWYKEVVFLAEPVTLGRGPLFTDSRDHEH